MDDGHGNLSGIIKAVHVEWTKDPNGHWNMTEIPGSEKLYKCDMALLALGFLGPEKSIIQQLELVQDPRSNIETPKGRYSTSVSKVFAAGDCR